MGLKFDKTLKKWGFEGVWADTELYSSKIVIVKSGERTPYIYNKARDKTIFVLQGVVVITIDGTNRILAEGDVLRILPKTMHRLTAMQGDATILEVGTKIEEDVIIEDDYTK